MPSNRRQGRGGLPMEVFFEDLERLATIDLSSCGWNFCLLGSLDKASDLSGKPVEGSQTFEII